MIRALLELLFTIATVMVARAVLTSIFRGLSNASSVAKQSAAQAPAPEIRGSNLHKDPVCGTYVPEGTRFQRHINGQGTFYYCSEQCRERHSLVAH